jgi:hypothetical protein
VHVHLFNSVLQGCSVHPQRIRACQTPPSLQFVSASDALRAPPLRPEMSNRCCAATGNVNDRHACYSSKKLVAAARHPLPLAPLRPVSPMTMLSIVCSMLAQCKHTQPGSSLCACCAACCRVRILDELGLDALYSLWRASMVHTPPPPSRTRHSYNCNTVG